ncbi:MAG TPA: hypothetical protein VHX65_05835 [Pirellulales bacterium]|nr:hypothetical protein [Pirellulales bacterium]
MKTIGKLFLGLGVLVAASPAQAGWLSNLNPFASKTSSSDDSGTEKNLSQPGSSASLSTALGSSKFNSKLPSGSGGATIVPELNGKPIHPVNSVTPASPSGPSLLSRIGSAPANLFAKTKGLFSKSTPAQPAQKRFMLGKPSGGSQFTHSGSAATRQSSSTSQFIARPRPGF